MPRPTLVAVTAALLASVALSACGSSTPSDVATVSTPAGGSAGGTATAGSLAGQTITVYNGQHEQTTTDLVNAFTKATGITVKVRSDDEDVLAQQIAQEGSRSPADVFFTENSPPLARLDEDHLLAKVSAGALADVPATDSAADGSWVGVSARISGLVYNTSALKPAQLPTSVLGLADAQWKGKLDIAPSETDFQPIVTSIDADKGDSATKNFLTSIKSNAGSHLDPDNETLVSNVNKGVTQLALVNSYYWYRLRQEVGAANMHSAIAYFAPGDSGYLKDISGAAVLASSKHQAAAQAFVAFLVSKAGETVLAAGDSYEYPVGSGVPANAVLPALSTLAPKSFDLEQIGDGKKSLTLLQDAGLV